mmetsp:Transcript_59244/g.138765  ORF Transcript_59244/g.138765 Transcript_59244/m.138765 type:complete len:200 (-) Transcript_59244:15-614(-)
MSASSFAATPAGSCASYQATSKENNAWRKSRCQRYDCCEDAHARQVCHTKVKKNCRKANPAIFSSTGVIMFITSSGAAEVICVMLSPVKTAMKGAETPCARAKSTPTERAIFSQHLRLDTTAVALSWRLTGPTASALTWISSFLASTSFSGCVRPRSTGNTSCDEVAATSATPVICSSCLTAIAGIRKAKRMQGFCCYC